jgi:hypothetical protein
MEIYLACGFGTSSPSSEAFRSSAVQVQSGRAVYNWTRMQSHSLATLMGCFGRRVVVLFAALPAATLRYSMHLDELAVQEQLSV